MTTRYQWANFLVIPPLSCEYAKLKNPKKNKNKKTKKPKNIQSFLIGIGFLTCFTEVSTDPWSTVAYVVLCLPLPYTCSSMLTWRETAWTYICSVRYCGLKLITFYLTEYSNMYLILDVWTRWNLNMIRNHEWCSIHTLLEFKQWQTFWPFMIFFFYYQWTT